MQLSTIANPENLLHNHWETVIVFKCHLFMEFFCVYNIISCQKSSLVDFLQCSTDKYTQWKVYLYEFLFSFFIQSEGGTFLTLKIPKGVRGEKKVENPWSTPSLPKDKSSRMS